MKTIREKIFETAAGVILLCCVTGVSISHAIEQEDDSGSASTKENAKKNRPGKVVAKTSLKIRKGPGVGFQKVGLIEEGERVAVLERGNARETIEEKTDFWYRVQKKDSITGWAFGAFLETAPLSSKASPSSHGVAVSTDIEQKPEPPLSSDIRPVDKTLLRDMLSARGFEIPETFKALLIEIVKNSDGTYTYYPMDVSGTSTDRDNWWPASTVKLYAAVAALEKLKALGFTPKAEMTFEYEETPVTQGMETLIRRAITDSKNPEFDRLVEFVGAKRLNRYFLVEEKGIKDTVMMRAYSGRVIHPELGKCTNRHSPPIRLVEGERTKTLSEQFNTETYDCEKEGNCTTLADLTEALRRVMMHEALPKRERYKLGPKELTLLRSALKGTWARGGVNDGLRAVFKGRPIEIFHKGGYADRWFSDNIFLKIHDTKEQWIIALVNRPGRDSLNQAALHVAAMIADGSLSRERKRRFKSTD